MNLLFYLFEILTTLNNNDFLLLNLSPNNLVKTQLVNESDQNLFSLEDVIVVSTERYFEKPEYYD